MSGCQQLADTTADMLDAISDKEYPCRKRGGFLPRKAPNLNQYLLLLGDILYRQYFATNQTCDSSTFRRRIRVSRNIFDLIFNAVVRTDDYLVQKTDCTGLLGISPYQKLTPM